MSNAHGGWPKPEPFRGVIFDVHSTLIDQGDAEEWLSVALGKAPQPLPDAERGELLAFLDRIWENARISDPDSSRDLSFEGHSRVFHELIERGPRVDRSLAQALYDVMLDTWHAYDDTVQTLQSLREADIRTCLLSNAGVPIAPVLDREGVTALVDGVVLSYEVGCVKPDPRIFQVALDTLGLPASAVLMVGDNANDDGGGTLLGIRTLILPRTRGPVHGLSAVTSLVLPAGASRSR